MSESYSRAGERYEGKKLSASRGVDDSLLRTILKMHEGGWVSTSIADYLTGIMKTKVDPSLAKVYLIRAHKSKERFHLFEKNNESAQERKFEDIMPGGEKVRLPGDRI